MSGQLNLLLIGAGKWGKTYISVLNKFPNVKLTVATKENWQQCIDKKPDGAIIATQPKYHIDIAEYALNNNIPVMIEKPLALSLKDAKRLEKFKTPILINNIYLFSEAFIELKYFLYEKCIENIQSYGCNNGPYRDYSSLLDYGPHDLSMILDIAKCMPKSVKASKHINSCGSLYNITMDFGKFKSNSVVGNGSFDKKRILTIKSSGVSVSYDHKDHPSHFSQPLDNAIQAFIDLINECPDDRAGINMSLNILKIIELCEQSIKTNNSIVYL